MERPRHPAAEARHPWLVRLLNAYFLLDRAVAQDLAQESARRGAPPACRPGCRTCCVGQVLPVSAFEALGLWCFALELAAPELRERLRANLHAHGQTPACPFLVHDACGAYALRPMVCRRHHVFGQPCRPGENLREQRPKDVFSAGHEALRAVAGELFPLHGVADEDVDWRFESGYVDARSRDLHGLPWKNLALRLDALAKGSA